MKPTPLQLRPSGLAQNSSDNSIQIAAPADTFASFPQRETTLRDYWLILKKQRWTALSFAGIVLTLASIITFKTTPIHDAVGRIAINRESEALPFKDTPSPVSDYEDYTIALDTQVRILHSDNLAIRVIRKLGLDTNPDFIDSRSKQIAGNGPFNSTPAVDSRFESELIDRFRAGLKVATLNNTRIIEIHYLNRNPRLAADIVNGIVSSYT